MKFLILSLLLSCSIGERPEPKVIKITKVKKKKKRKKKREFYIPGIVDGEYRPSIKPPKVKR